MDRTRAGNEGLSGLSPAETSPGQEVAGPFTPYSSDASQATTRYSGWPGSASPRWAWPLRYADTPDELDHVLRFVPPHPYLPVVHLNRRVNVLHERSRAVIADSPPVRLPARV